MVITFRRYHSYLFGKQTPRSQRTSYLILRDCHLPLLLTRPIRIVDERSSSLRTIKHSCTFKRQFRGLVIISLYSKNLKKSEK